MQRRTTFHHKLTALLTVAIAFALFAGGWLLSSPAAADPGPADTEHVVRDFYAAVNESIRTGNVAALDEVVADDLIAHSTLATVAPDHAGLVRYLTSLHTTFPHLQLTVTDVVVTSDRAIADVAIENGAAGMFLGGTLRGGEPWGETDAFRITDHQISELWSGPQEVVLLESGAQAPYQVLDPPERTITLDRLTIPVGASYAASSTEEQRWLFVEASTVTAASARHERTTAMELGLTGNIAQFEPRPTEQRNPATLETGDLVALPIWSQTEIHNIGVEPASLLVLAAGSPIAIGNMQTDPAGHGGEISTDAIAGWPGWPGGTVRISESGATLASLTGNTTTKLSDKRTVVAVGQAVLAPGSAFAVQVAGPHMLVVDSGMLDLISEGEPARIHQGSGADLNAGALGPGAGALLRTGSVAHFLNPGDEPTVVTIIALIPSSALTGNAA
jgi:predicted SnoaL-like aldol condensation-catalyzing enzyme